MNIEQNSRLAATHTRPPVLSAIAQADRDKLIVLRYDGMEEKGEQKVFAMIAAADLAKLQADVLDDLPLALRDKDGVLHGSKDAFFMQTEAGTTLFVNSDEHSDFIDRVIDTAYDNGLFVENYRADLRGLMNEDLDIEAPAHPAFIENACPHVPAALAIKEIKDARMEARNVPPSPTLL